MRNVGEERLLLGAEFFIVCARSFQPLGKDIHRPGEGADFVAAADLRTGFVLSAGERKRNLLQGGNRSCEYQS